MSYKNSRWKSLNATNASSKTKYGEVLIDTTAKPLSITLLWNGLLCVLAVHSRQYTKHIWAHKQTYFTSPRAFIVFTPQSRYIAWNLSNENSSDDRRRSFSSVLLCALLQRLATSVFWNRGICECHLMRAELFPHSSRQRCARVFCFYNFFGEQK